MKGVARKIGGFLGRRQGRQKRIGWRYVDPSTIIEGWLQSTRP
jgi:hypothetical protein